MAYKCRICGTNDVEHVGDVCELCAIGQDPYAAAMQNNNVTPEVSKQGLFRPQTSSDTGNYIPRRGKNRRVLLNGGASVANVDPYGNSIFSQDESSIHVYQAGQVPVSQQVTNQPITISTGNTNATGSVIGVNKNKPLTSGITKNISVDVQKKSALRKLFRTLFKGIPYALDNDITMFQVFPDYTGTSLNAMGNACDQVIVYGKLNAGAVSENNDVEVYGHRDADNNIVAKKIVNKASGTTATPDRVIPVAVIWAITIIAFAVLTFFVWICGVEGIVWTAIIILCLTHFPLVFKIIAGIFGILFSFIRRM